MNVRLTWLIVAALAFGGCGDDDSMMTPDTGPDMDDAGEGTDAGMGDDGGSDPDLDPPLLMGVPAATNMANLTIMGTAGANIRVTVAGAATPAMSETDAAGDFSVDVVLRQNAINTLNFFAVDPATGTSGDPTTAVILHDNIAPDAPSVDPTTSPTGAMRVRLSGEAEANSRIQVAGGAAPATGATDELGRYRVEVMLTADSDNELEVTAEDAAGNASEATTLTITQDSTLPVPVEVDPVDSPTSDNPITLTGLTEADSMVQVTGGAAPATTTADGDGAFSVDVTLNANARNDLLVQRVGGEAITTVVVVHDDIAPEAPTVDPLASPTNRTDLTVTGSTEPRARVRVRGATEEVLVTADEAGSFSADILIAEDSETTLMVTATDRASNASSPTTVSVTHSSDVADAPEVDPVTSPTNMAMVTLTGRVLEPGAGITVNVAGGASPASAATDEGTGAFTIDVMLNANDTNTLEVTSMEGEIESPATVVTIVHDDIAPDAPNGDAISNGTPGGLGCTLRGSTNVTGGSASVEGNSRVRIENFTAGGTNVTTTANPDGSFSTAIAACVGDLLRITATDAANNTSDVTEITVE